MTPFIFAYYFLLRRLNTLLSFWIIIFYYTRVPPNLPIGVIDDTLIFLLFLLNLPLTLPMLVLSFFRVHSMSLHGRPSLSTFMQLDCSTPFILTLFNLPPTVLFVRLCSSTFGVRVFVLRYCQFSSLDNCFRVCICKLALYRRLVFVLCLTWSYLIRVLYHGQFGIPPPPHIYTAFKNCSWLIMQFDPAPRWLGLCGKGGLSTMVIRHLSSFHSDASVTHLITTPMPLGKHLKSLLQK